jgi:hypothetical protein
MIKIKKVGKVLLRRRMRRSRLRKVVRMRWSKK